MSVAFLESALHVAGVMDEAASMAAAWHPSASRKST
jgi:hypothetical protein